MNERFHGPGGQQVIEEFAEKLRRVPVGAQLVQQERFTRFHLENQGKSVAELKAVLKYLGYYHGETNEVFDAELAQAIKDFQKAYSLSPVDGIFGPSCFFKLAEIAHKRE